MATSAVAASDGVSVGRVLGRAFGVIAANPLVMLGVSFLFAAVPGAVIGYSVQGYRLALSSQPEAFRDAMFLSVGVGLVMLVLTMVVQGALVRATVAHAEGREASFGESVTTGLRVVLPLIGLAILFGLAIMLGFVLFVIPGIILYTVWSVAMPALVEEQTGIFAAFGRSAQLTKGARWKVFGLNLVVLIAIWIVTAIVGVVQIAAVGGSIGQPAADVASPIVLLVNAVSTTLITAFWAAAQTALFVELREWKDGPQAAHLGEIFA